jgi:TrpR family trp operon transcriptional repressor
MTYQITKEGWQDFLRLCATIQSPEEFNQLFNLFLTIEEKETLASRYLIIKALLGENLTQREIAEQYKVSIAQITRGSNALKIISPELKNALKTKLK